MPTEADIEDLSSITARYDVLDREEDQLRSRLREIEEEKKHLGHRAFHVLNAVGAERMRAAPFDVNIEEKRGFKATEWDQFYDWVRTNNRFDTLHRRLSVTVLDDMLESEGELPPGIEKTEYRDIKFKRVSSVRSHAHTGAKAA